MPEAGQVIHGWPMPQVGLVRQLIRRVVVGTDVPAGSASVTVRDLPQQFAHLELIVRGKTDDTGSEGSLITFTVPELAAGSTEYGYGQTQLFGTTLSGASTQSTATPVLGFIAASNSGSGFPADAAGGIRATFVGYSSTLWYKHMVSQSYGQMRATAATCFLYTHGVQIRSTRPITGFTFTLLTGNFMRGTQFDFYGDP